MSVCGPTGTGEITGEEFTEQRTLSSTGDSAFFARKMIALAVQHRDEPGRVQEIFYGTEVRTRHSTNFSKTFSKLLEAAKAVDTDDMLCDALLNGSAQGLLFRIIGMARNDDSIEPFLGLTPEQNTVNEISGNSTPA